MIMNVIEKLHLPMSGIRPKRESLGVIPDYFSQEDIRLFKEGEHCHLYRKFGAHLMTLNHLTGTYFAVWAPNARLVSVIGDFNNWKHKNHCLNLRTDNSGIWEGFIPGVVEGDLYQYHIVPKRFRRGQQKADPYAVAGESAPKTESRVYRIDYHWNDGHWMNARKGKDYIKAPVAIYEIHLGSWQRNADGQFLNYHQIADKLVPYIKDLGFTHVEIMPLMEHPFYGSWGYQALSYFAPTARYGKPEDFMYLVDQLHRNGIGVILDWVASHFPYDSHGLALFDGTPLYECGELHPEWKSCMFNLGKHQTVDFLISSALYWIEQYHIDGIRVDAVASMLYLDYSRQAGQWKPNFFGGTENIESVSFIRRLNESIKSRHPDVQIIAEDSTAWPNVSKPCDMGGLHFDMKWNMGWMHDTLKYFRRDFPERGLYYDEIAFCLHYAFSENFVLSLSHDEVVYAKGSLIGKMQGTDEEKFAGLKSLYGYMYAHPGKKLLFMGGEFAQWPEWNHDSQLDWDMLKYDRHQHIYKWVTALNEFYKKENALHAKDADWQSFQWLDMGRKWNAVFCFFRKGGTQADTVLVLCNFNNKPMMGYTIEGVSADDWNVVLSSTEKPFGGHGKKICDGKSNGFNLYPLSVTFLKSK